MWSLWEVVICRIVEWICQREVNCGMKLLERIFSRNWFTLVFYMYFMRFRLETPITMEALFSNVSFSRYSIQEIIVNFLMLWMILDVTLSFLVSSLLTLKHTSLYFIQNNMCITSKLLIPFSAGHITLKQSLIFWFVTKFQYNKHILCWWTKFPDYLSVSYDYDCSESSLIFKI